MWGVNWPFSPFMNWTLYEHFKVLNTPIDFQLPAKQQKRFTDTDRMTDKRL